jgi:acetyl-CoA acetyltransferase family protein
MKEKIVLIDGCRTPFLKSETDFLNTMTYELGQLAIKGLLSKTGIDPKIIDSVVMGCVISTLKTSNLAREAALTAGIPYTTPCHTVTQACISANRAIVAAIGEINSGQAEIVIAGGADSASETPIGYKKSMRTKLMKANKIKSFGDTLKFVSKLKLKDFLPETPSITEFTTNKTMGQDCDIMVAKHGISRTDQDKLAIVSHDLAEKAWEDGHHNKEVIPVQIPPKFKFIHKDNGIRPGSKIEKLAKLRPVFDKKHGTLNAANSSFLTDGSAVVLLMTESKAKELGLTPKAEIIDYSFTGQRLEDELLLGPAFAMSKALDNANLKLEDMDVFEIHEAFAGQVLANIKCLDDKDFCKERLKKDKTVGKIEMNKVNQWGGSLSIGHPFGATGARLLNTAANRLHEEGGKYAILSACAAGAHGHAMIIKKYEN